MTTKRKTAAAAATSLPDVVDVKCDALVALESGYLVLARIRGEVSTVSSLGSVTGGLMPQAQMQVTRSQPDRLGSLVIPSKGSTPEVLLVVAVLHTVPTSSGEIPILLNLDNGKRGVGKARLQRIDASTSDNLGKVVRAYAPLLQQMV